MNGEQLRTRREALGMTQVALATFLGVQPNTVWRWEHGDRPINRPKLLDYLLSRLEEERSLKTA